MNWKDLNNDDLISKTGKIAFGILILIAYIALSKNFIALLPVIFIVLLFFAAYGKEIIMPYLSYELRLLWQIGDIGIAVIKLFMILLRSKGELTNKDLYILENYFIKEYNEEVGKDVKQFAKKNFHKRFMLSSVCKELSDKLQRKQKYELIEQLFLFCKYTGTISSKQQKIIYRIAKEIKLSSVHFNIIKNKYIKSASQNKQDKKQSHKQKSEKNHQRRQTSRYNSMDFAYSELGVKPTISNAELKKVYRSLAKQFHPDKLIHKTAFERKKAKEKFQRINNAYAIIKKSRNMS